MLHSGIHLTRPLLIFFSSNWKMTDGHGPDSRKENENCWIQLALRMKLDRNRKCGVQLQFLFHKVI